MKFTLLLVGLYIVSIFVALTTALPTGAPFCGLGGWSIGMPRIGHCKRPQECWRNQVLLNEGSPNEGAGYQLILAGAVLSQTFGDFTFANVFQSGIEHELVAQSPLDSYFKGLLVIASDGDSEYIDRLDTRTPAALTIIDRIGTNESIGCENFAVSSVGHTEPTEKNNLTMNFKWPNDGQRLFLDVYIVKNNNDTAGSQYYYTQYPMLSIPQPTQCLSSCGALGLQFYCPFTRCGIFGRLLGLCICT